MCKLCVYFSRHLTIREIALIMSYFLILCLVGFPFLGSFYSEEITEMHAHVITHAVQMRVRFARSLQGMYESFARDVHGMVTLSTRSLTS